MVRGVFWGYEDFYNCCEFENYRYRMSMDVMLISKQEKKAVPGPGSCSWLVA